MLFFAIKFILIVFYLLNFSCGGFRRGGFCRVAVYTRIFPLKTMTTPFITFGSFWLHPIFSHRLSLPKNLPTPRIKHIFVI